MTAPAPFTSESALSADTVELVEAMRQWLIRQNLTTDRQLLAITEELGEATKAWTGLDIDTFHSKLLDVAIAAITTAAVSGADVNNVLGQRLRRAWGRANPRQLDSLDAPAARNGDIWTSKSNYRFRFVHQTWFYQTPFKPGEWRGLGEIGPKRLYNDGPYTQTFD